MSFLYHSLPVLGSAVVKRLDSQLSAFDCSKAETKEGSDISLPSILLSN